MSYPGGKNGSGVYQNIINRIPPHTLYVEPFLGSGAVMRLKRPALASVGIDIDGAVLSAFDRSGIPCLTLHCCDSLDWLADSHHEIGTFIYCDPPYIINSRSSNRRIYLHELTDSDHLRFLEAIRNLRCMVMVSCYPNQLYEDVLSDWRSEYFHTTNRRGTLTSEVLFMNYPEPSRLHDYSYLGRDFRERERIRKKIRRWVARLASMPRMERYALAAAIAALDDGGRHR